MVNISLELGNYGYVRPPMNISAHWEKTSTRVRHSKGELVGFPSRTISMYSEFVGLIAFVFTITHMYNLMPRNTLTDCERQCSNSENPEACKIFCESIHNTGQDLDKSLDAYEQAVKAAKIKRTRSNWHDWTLCVCFTSEYEPLSLSLYSIQWTWLVKIVCFLQSYEAIRVWAYNLGFKSTAAELSEVTVNVKKQQQQL